jgi:hypothetical protein
MEDHSLAILTELSVDIVRRMLAGGSGYGTA